MQSHIGLVQLREAATHLLLLFVSWDYLEITGKHLSNHAVINFNVQTLDYYPFYTAKLPCSNE